MTGPKGWLNQLVGLLVVVAMGGWVLQWTLSLIAPLAPYMLTIVLLTLAGWALRSVINRRRSW